MSAPADGGSSAPLLRAVVLNYNGGSYLVDAVRALHDVDWPSDRLEIVLVDNSSTDGSDIDVERTFPDVRVVRSPTNLGFPGNNLAMGDLDEVDYVALVNPDAFVTPGFFAPLVGVLEEASDVGAACPTILFAPSFCDLDVESSPFEPGRGDPRSLGVRISGVRADSRDLWTAAQLGPGCYPVESGSGVESHFAWTDGRGTVRLPVSEAPHGEGFSVRLASGQPVAVTLRSGDWSAEVKVGREPTWYEIEPGGPTYDVINNAGSVLVEGGFGADRGYLERDEGQYDQAADVFAWCGAAVLLRPAYLDDVGLFDERFFLYYEDTDLSWRGRGRGWRYRYVPDAVARHIHSASTTEGSPLFTHFVERNRLAMLTKNAPAGFAVRQAIRYLLSTASYARRDVIRPLLAGRPPSASLVLRRLRSYAAWLKMLPGLLASRRRIRMRQQVGDHDVMRWMVPQ